MFDSHGKIIGLTCVLNVIFKKKAIFLIKIIEF